MAEEICPSCGRPLAHKFYKVLSDTEQAIFDIIVKTGGAGITQREIADKLYAGRAGGGPENTRNALGVYLHKIRAKLRKTNYHIVCYGHRYRVENRGL